MAKVQYIGRKPQATDRHTGSGKVWAGNGDVQEVTDAQAAHLCKFTDSFVLVVPKAQEPAGEPGDTKAPEGSGEPAAPTGEPAAQPEGHKEHKPRKPRAPKPTKDQPEAPAATVEDGAQ
jgi:hypothetical protein